MALSVILCAGCAGPRHDPEAPRPWANAAPCRFVILNGVDNLPYSVRGISALVRERFPGCDVDERPWGAPGRTYHNLTAEEHNRETARRRAAELAAFARAHPEARIVVIGYSGGGGMAVFLVEALPDDVRIDRLILIAAAIAPDYPIVDRVLPRVNEFVVNYASCLDLQVSLGTAALGTMDRSASVSAGYRGFELEHPKLVQIDWDAAAMRRGHFGNHLGYLTPTWQANYLPPALDPGLDADGVRSALASP